ncbi:MAG: glycosyltransferase family 4 protein [Candidatus Helarchaeota archaeon]
MDNLKVAFVSAFWTRLGGGEIGADLLRKGIQKKGIDLRVLTTQKMSKDKEFIPFNLRFPISKEMILFGHTILDKLMKRSIERSLKDYKFVPDIFHVQNIYSLPACAEVAKKMKIPYIITIREPLPKVLLHPYNILLKFIISQNLKSRNKILLKILKDECNGVISVSDFIKNRLMKMGISKNKIFTIYNFPPQWKDLDNDIKLKESKNRKKITIFYSGRLERAKGIHVLIFAIRKILKKINNIELKIAGEGPYEKQLRHTCRKLGLEKNVDFLGKVAFKKMGKLYQSVNIVCIPSVWPEPLSRVTFEAMSLGKPVISSNVGGQAEAIEDGKTGLLVPPNNVNELADAILKLVNNEELRRNLGLEGKKIVKNKFNLDISVNKHIELYKKVISDFSGDFIK